MIGMMKLPIFGRNPENSLPDGERGAYDMGRSSLYDSSLRIAARLKLVVKG